MIFLVILCSFRTLPQHQKCFHFPIFNLHSPLPASGNYTSSLCSYSFFPLMIFYKLKNTEYGLRDWLLSLSMMFSSFIYAVACIRTLFCFHSHIFYFEQCPGYSVKKALYNWMGSSETGRHGPVMSSRVGAREWVTLRNITLSVETNLEEGW